MRRSVQLLAIATLLVGAVGCIERRLVLRSDPPGANAFVDGILVGPTPVSVDFEHYGHHTVVLRKAEFQTLRKSIHVHGPWYLSFPFDLFTEHLWIGGHVDLHEHQFVLRSNDPASEVDAFIEEATALGVPVDARAPEARARDSGAPDSKTSREATNEDGDGGR